MEPFDDSAEMHEVMPPDATMEDMPKNIAGTVLASNLRALMDAKQDTQVDLSKRSGINQGLISRILRAEHAVRIDTLENLARAYDLAAWQLLVPNLDPSNPPTFAMTQTERDLYWRLHQDIARLIGAAPHVDQEDHRPDRPGAPDVDPDPPLPANGSTGDQEPDSDH